MDRNNKIFLIGELTTIFMQTMHVSKFFFFCPPAWRQWKPPIVFQQETVSPSGVGKIEGDECASIIVNP